VNFDWLLTQVFSYMNRFYSAVASPEALLAQSEGSPDKNITEAVIFFVISVGVETAGLDFLTNKNVDFPQELISLGLVGVIFMVVTSLGAFVAWRVVGSSLPFGVFLRGTAYYTGVIFVFGMVFSVAFVGAVSRFSPGALAEARLAVWSVFIRPQEMEHPNFPENWADGVVLVTFISCGISYLTWAWWRSYGKLSKLDRKHTAWAFLNFLSYQVIVTSLLRGVAAAVRR